jgi:predicted exporter
MLITLSNQYDWLDWVDPVTSSRLALDAVQQGLLARILIAFVAVMALLKIRYRQQALQVLQIPTVAILLAMVVEVILGQPFTLFHCAALLVGFGLALDYGVFTQESPTQSTLLAIVLSALTTLLAFGLLAFSSTPAVAWFGQTVAISVSVSALLAIGLTRIEND